NIKKTSISYGGQLRCSDRWWSESVPDAPSITEVGARCNVVANKFFNLDARQRVRQRRPIGARLRIVRLLARAPRRASRMRRSVAGRWGGPAGDERDVERSREAGGRARAGARGRARLVRGAGASSS